MFRANRPEPDKKKDFDSPLDELNHSLDFLDGLIRQSMDDFVESIRPPPPEKNRRTSVLDSLKKLRGGRASIGDEESPTKMKTPEKAPIKSAGTPDSTASNRSAGSFFGRDFVEEARFVPMGSERVDDFVETMRRISELVIIGERSHAKAEDDEKAKAHMAIFETFFERDGLATITNILIGDSFNLLTHPAVLEQLEGKEIEKPVHATESDEEPPAPRPIPLEDHSYKLLPPLAIATQAIQSISILVQNVSRATSLFFLLSNNHVNQLINFPLEQYQTAERRNHDVGDAMRKFASPELAELTTHFVTFLKSLALRMNNETLQFFLTYPADMPTEEVEDIIVIDTHMPVDEALDGGFDDEERPLDETEETKVPSADSSQRPVSIKTVQLNFPLYDRALEFCAAHHDSFVRVTAMNICLNTLRLATVIPGGNDGEGDGNTDLGKSPDGVLHNAKPLPLKERVSIAQFVCTPARVERLASPLFTKLAQLWGVLEEQFRDMDAANIAGSKSDQEFSSSKVARAKEKARRQKAAEGFNDTAYNVQDELLLLEDVLKVGLTSLNEQMIEMMFATFVYPLLLQPLLLYFQRSPVPDEVLFADPLNEHTAGRPIVNSDMNPPENAIVLAPAKAAFFFLGAAFQFLTNPPLLRLLFASLFHPLAPEATGETMIQAKADVACLDSNGKVQIRIDQIDDMDGSMKLMTDRSTYVFGTITGQKCYSSNNVTRNAASSDTSCVFVLAPALAEILEFRGNDAALVARTRPNPYRKAIFQCFSLSSQLSDLRPLSVLAVQTAITKFPPKFLSDILFGMDVQKFQDDLPRDEASHGILASLDDRDIGGGTTTGQSRLSLGEKGTGRIGYDCKNEVLSAFKNCILRAVAGAKGTWVLEYDMIAACGLVCIVRGNNEALLEAARRVDSRCRHAAEFLSDIPHSLQRFSGPELSTALKGLDKDAEKEGGAMEGAIMEALFRGVDKSSPCVLNELVEMTANLARKSQHPVYGIEVLDSSSYADMCKRCSTLPPLDAEEAEGAIRCGMGSAKAWVQLGMFGMPDSDLSASFLSLMICCYG